MSNKYNIRYLPVAVDDLLSIFDWIANDSLDRAATFIETLDRRIHHLTTYPLFGRHPKDEKLQKLGYRVVMIESYLVFYLIHGHTVEIHRVIHGSRNLDDII